MLFVNETGDLNAFTFNKEIGFHILPNFEPHGGYLKIFSYEIRGGRFQCGNDMGSNKDKS